MAGIFSSDNGRSIFDTSQRSFSSSMPDPRTYLAAQQQKARDERRRNFLKPVEWLFDRLSTGNYIMANLTDQALKKAKGEETDLWEALKGSVTAERDTTFSDVIREHGGDWWDQSWFEGLKDRDSFIGNILGNLDAAGVAGFALDVVSDPINYLTLGTTKLAKKAAKNYADEVLQNAFQRPDVIGAVSKSLNPSVANDLANAAGDVNKQMRILNDNGIYDFSRKMNDLWKQSYRDGLRMSEDEMKAALTGIWGEVQSTRQKDLVREGVRRYQQRMIKPYENFFGPSRDSRYLKQIYQRDPQGAKRLEAAAQNPENVYSPSTYNLSKEDVYKSRVEYLKSDEFFQEQFDLVEGVLRGDIDPNEMADELRKTMENVFLQEGPKDRRWSFWREGEHGQRELVDDGAIYETMADLAQTQRRISEISTGAGKVAFNVFGKAIGAHLRGKNPAINAFDNFMDGIRSNVVKEDGRLSRAVYSVMNNGPVGILRRMFGFRNPYQKAIHTIELQQKANLNYEMENMIQRVDDLLEGFDDGDPILNDYLMYRARAQESNKLLQKKADEYARRQMQLGEFRYAVDPDSEPITIARDLEYELKRSIPSERYPEYKEHIKDFLTDQRVTPTMLATADEYADIARLTELDDRVSRFLDGIDIKEHELMERGLLDFRESMDVYLPYVFRRTKKHVGGAATTTRRVSDPSQLTQQVGTQRGIEMEISSLESLYGLTREQAEKLVQDNATSVVTDLKEILMRRGVHHSIMANEANALDQMRQFGFNVYEIPTKGINRDLLQAENYMAKLGLQTPSGNMSGAFSRSGPNGYKYFFDRDVSEAINRMTQIQKEPGMFKNGIRNYTNWWRGIVTSNPGFHIRNFYSNMSMIYTEFGPKAFTPRYVYDGALGAAVGLKGPKALREAGTGSSKAAVRLQTRYGGWTMRELVDEARKRGIINRSSRGYSNDDPIRNLMKIDDRSKYKQALSKYSPLSSQNKLFEFSKDVGGFIESSSRFQAFLMEIDEMTRLSGVTEKVDSILEAAAQKSKQLLLDYDDLTKFEREWGKAVIPFYTWMRKNLANQLFMLQNPRYWGRYSNIEKMRELFDDDDMDIDERDLPDYMREDGYFAIGRTDEGEVMTLWPNLPVFDLNMLPIAFHRGTLGAPIPQGPELLNTITDSAHPALKAAIESVTGYDTFREREIQPTEEADRYFGLVQRFPRLMGLIDPLVAAGNDGLGIVGGVDSEGVMQFNGEIVRAVDTLFPLANALNRYIDAIEEVPEHVFNTNVIEESVDAFMGARDPEEGTKELLRTMSYMLGVKASSYDEREARLWRAKDIYDRALKQRRAEEELAPNRRARQIEWMNRQEGMYRRLGIY